jgi:hypothetical protein
VFELLYVAVLIACGSCGVLLVISVETTRPDRILGMVMIVLPLAIGGYGLWWFSGCTEAEESCRSFPREIVSLIWATAAVLVVAAIGRRLARARSTTDRTGGGR